MKICKVHRLYHPENCPKCKPGKKKVQSIKKVSDKRQKINIDYSKEAKLFREENQLCAINSPVCTTWTQGVHHKRGRIGEYLTDKRYWLPACNACNVYVEANDAWARANGYKESKHIRCSM